MYGVLDASLSGLPGLRERSARRVLRDAAAGLHRSAFRDVLGSSEAS